MDVEFKEWERKNSELALNESQRELESQRLQLRQANEWADQAQRERISLYDELKNRLHGECYRRTPQEIEELWRRCHKDVQELHDPDSGSSSGQSQVPNQHRIIASSRRKPSQDSGVPRNTRDDLSIRDNVFEDLLAQVHPKEFFENSKNLET